MTKKIIRLTESDLHRIVKESVNRILKEDNMFHSDILDGVNELCNEIDEKFGLNKYDMIFHGSIQNGKIVFQLDNTVIRMGEEDQEECSWEMFRNIAHSIYKYLISIGIKLNGRPRFQKGPGDWVDEEMFAFMYAEMNIPDEYMKKGAETKRLHIEKSKAAKAELERKKAEQLRAKEEKERQKEIQRQKVISRIQPPTDKVKKQMDDMWKQHDNFAKSKTDKEMKQMWDWQKRNGRV